MRINGRNQHRYLGPDPAPEPPKVEPKPPEKTLTQAEVDSIVAKRVAEEKAKHLKESAAQLERIKQLEPDAAAKVELEKRIEDIERQGMSEKQIVEMDRKKEKEKLEGEKKAAAADAKRWKDTYEAEKLVRDLTDAAASKEVDAYNANQLATFLKPNARLAEKLVDGKPTGEFETRVKFQVKKDGGKVEVDLTPPELLKLMKDDPEHGNFFRAGVVGGIGSGQIKTKANTGGLLSLPQEEFNKRYAKGTLPKNTR